MRNVLRDLGFLLLAIVLFSGCNGPASSDVFPPNIAGTWQAEGSVWKIVLSKDGKVESALMPLGEAEVRPNQTSKFEMKDGSMSHITAGDCLAEYKPAKRELMVSVEVKDFYISFPGDALKGNTLDIFRGPVSRDGKTWNAEWIRVFDYGPRFPQDENEPNIPKPIVFRKVKEQPKPVLDSNTPR